MTSLRNRIPGMLTGDNATSLLMCGEKNISFRNGRPASITIHKS